MISDGSFTTGVRRQPRDLGHRLQAWIVATVGCRRVLLKPRRADGGRNDDVRIDDDAHTSPGGASGLNGLQRLDGHRHSGLVIELLPQLRLLLGGVSNMDVGFWGSEAENPVGPAGIEPATEGL